MAKGNNWLDRMIEDENQAHKAFFGMTFDLSKFAAILEKYGQERVEEWAQLQLEPHFLPAHTFGLNDSIAETPGWFWEARPNDWMWSALEREEIKIRTATGELEVVTKLQTYDNILLADRRRVPRYNANVQQQFADDEIYLAPIIETLRNEGKILHNPDGPPASRFNISSKEWDEQIRPVLQMLPLFKDVELRFERIIEFLVFLKMKGERYHSCSNRVWLEEFRRDEAMRECTCPPFLSGPKNFVSIEVDHHGRDHAIRPVGVLTL